MLIFILFYFLFLLFYGLKIILVHLLYFYFLMSKSLSSINLRCVIDFQYPVNDLHCIY